MFAADGVADPPGCAEGTEAGVPASTSSPAIRSAEAAPPPSDAPVPAAVEAIACGVAEAEGGGG